MKPNFTEQTYTLTEEQLKKALEIEADEDLIVVVLHENKDGNKIEIRTVKGDKGIVNFKQVRGGYS